MDALGKAPQPSRRALIGTAAALGVNLAGFATWRLLRDEADSDADGMLLASVPSGDLGLEDVGGGVRSLDVPITAPAGASARSAGLGTPRMATDRFRMLGVTWRGPRNLPIEYRTRTPGRGWTAWQAAPMLTDGPDPTSGEGDPDLRATAPIWVDVADGVQIRVRGRSPERLDLTLIDPGRLATDSTDSPDGGGRGGRAEVDRGVSGRRSGGLVIPAGNQTAHAPRPKLYTRKAWGANESWRNGKPEYNRRCEQVHVHHTASSNNYSRGDVPAIIRSMYRYHTHSLGWDDIGYNFLIDKFGRIWVGRGGGPLKNVRGAHTLGFNHASTGVACIGNFTGPYALAPMKWSLIYLTAWQLDRRGHNPAGTVVMTSEGSDKFPRGRKVRLPRMDGHRDTNHTACPGNRLYGRLPALRDKARRRAQRFNG